MTRKKEAKLVKKLKLLGKRKDKRIKRKGKLPEKTEIKQNKEDKNKNVQPPSNPQSESLWCLFSL